MMMDIRSISNSPPPAGIRQAVESAPVSPSVQNLEQVMAKAVRPPAAAEKAGAGQKTTTPEMTSFRQSRQAQSEAAAQPTDLNRVKEAMESIAQSLGSLSKSTNLEFSIDDELGCIVVKVVDPETKDVIKQFPSEDAIALAKSLDNGNSGGLHQVKA
ncbi:MAG: flagellar protein FlaG [Oxalobacter sp.]|nr:flagellar protein FlaG [Oxalobacter sp.]